MLSCLLPWLLSFQSYSLPLRLQLDLVLFTFFLLYLYYKWHRLLLEMAPTGKLASPFLFLAFFFFSTLQSSISWPCPRIWKKLPGLNWDRGYMYKLPVRRLKKTALPNIKKRLGMTLTGILHDVLFDLLFKPSTKTYAWELVYETRNRPTEPFYKRLNTRH